MARSHEKDRIYLSVKNTVSDLKLLDDYDTEEPWKSAVIKRKFLLDRILKEYDPPELSDPRDYDGGQTEEQPQTTSKVNNDQEGRGGGGSDGSDKLKVNLVSPSEEIALRAKEELLREDRKREFDGFTPEHTAEIERMKKQRRSGAPWTIIQILYKMRDLTRNKCVTFILSNFYLVISTGSLRI